ncbi:MAG: hypothetical protein ACRENY_02070 [Candidatus Dormibacteria bacterium]
MTSYLALILLVVVMLGLVLISVNHGVLGHVAGLRPALGLRHH